MELGETSDPRQLIPGDSGAIANVAGAMYAYGNALHAAGVGLARIDTTAGWSGAAADAFRKRFSGHPQQWVEAGLCFQDAAAALDGYIPVLDWAQQRAGEAIRLWAESKRQAASDTLSSARSQLSSAGDTAAAAVGKARDKAPPKPGFWSQVGHFFDGLGHDAEHVGADVLNGLASLGNAAIHHPLDGLGVVGGGLLAGVSALGDGAGVALDATGVGAVAGVPLNAVSTAGVVAGTGLAMASMGDLARHAGGDDNVEPVKSSGGGGDGGGPAQDPQHLQDLGTDPATSQFRPAEAQTGARIENETGVSLERSSEAKGPDWKGSDGKTYDAVGNFPAKYFDSQWGNLQQRIIDHLGKADYVPVDVSQFSPEQIAQVEKFIEPLGPRVFTVGGG